MSTNEALSKELDKAIEFTTRQVSEIEQGKLDSDLLDLLESPLPREKFPLVMAEYGSSFPVAPEVDVTKEQLLEMLEKKSVSPDLSKLLEQVSSMASKEGVKVSMAKKPPKDALDFLRMKKGIQNESIKTKEQFYSEFEAVCDGTRDSDALEQLQQQVAELFKVERPKSVRKASEDSEEAEKRPSKRRSSQRNKPRKSPTESRTRRSK